MLLKPRLWLVLLVLAILALAAFFALPNIYDSQPSIDITRDFDADEQKNGLEELKRLLDKAFKDGEMVKAAIYPELDADELLPSNSPTIKNTELKADQLVVEFDSRNKIPSVEGLTALMQAIVEKRGRNVTAFRISESTIVSERIIKLDFSQQAIDLAVEILQAENIPYLQTERTLSAGRIRFENGQQQSDALNALKQLEGYTASLNVVPGTPDWLKSLGGEPMALGLDLQGGLSILYEVAIEGVYEKRRDGAMRKIKMVLSEAQIDYGAGAIENGIIRIPLFNPAELEKAQDLIADEVDSVQVEFNDDSGELVYRLTDAAIDSARSNAMNKNLNTMRKRIEELNIAEAVVQQQGELRILVDLPGVDDRSLVDNITASNASISYHAVLQSRYPARQTPNGPAADAYMNIGLEADASGYVEEGYELLYERNSDRTPIVIQSEPIVTGEDLIDAQAGTDQTSGSPQVSVQLTTESGFDMSRWTGKNIGNFMAVKYTDTQIVGRDDEGQPILDVSTSVISAATINGQFSTNFQTTGLDDRAEAQRLALLLRSGSLAAPVFIISENSVSASLGADNIEQGVYAVILGFLLVVAFMFFYYRGFGLVANCALVANLVLVVGVMSLPFVPATLTLPGIAGLVLTVGMAVDANVLIFERIREELRAGLTPQAAIVAGYQRALVTITDANITTFLTAAILYIVGTGPVKGFATTLGIGILASMFTAIVLTRVMVSLWYGGDKRVSKISI